jgi:molecular chaperone DnaK (HSP70)
MLNLGFKEVRLVQDTTAAMVYHCSNTKYEHNESRMQCIALFGASYCSMSIFKIEGNNNIVNIIVEYSESVGIGGLDIIKEIMIYVMKKVRNDYSTKSLMIPAAIRILILFIHPAHCR